MQLLNCLRVNGSRGILAMFLWSSCMPDTAQWSTIEIALEIWTRTVTLPHLPAILYRGGGTVKLFSLDLHRSHGCPWPGLGDPNPWTPWPARACNRLRLNPGKTELIWLGTCRRLEQLNTVPLFLSGTCIQPSHRVRNLGVVIASELSSVDTSTCFFCLRQIRHIRRSDAAHCDPQSAWLL